MPNLKVYKKIDNLPKKVYDYLKPRVNESKIKFLAILLISLYLHFGKSVLKE